MYGIYRLQIKMARKKGSLLYDTVNGEFLTV